MTKPKAMVKANEATSRQVRSATQAVSERCATALWKIYSEFIECGGTFMELATLAEGEENSERQQIATFIRDTIRGVKQSVSSVAVDLAQKLGIIEEVTDIVPPPGGKVFRVLVRVDWTKNWREFIFANCPQTGHDWDVLTVGDQYEPVNLKEEVLLVWFGKGVRIMAERADAWAEKNGLVQSHGRIPVAVIGSVGDIVDQLKKCGFPYDSAGVVSTSSCKLGGDSYVPYAWRYYVGGGASLSRVSGEWDGRNLFAFSRK